VNSLVGPDVHSNIALTTDIDLGLEILSVSRDGPPDRRIALVNETVSVATLMKLIGTGQC
jgi:hypothetical protein